MRAAHHLDTWADDLDRGGRRLRWDVDIEGASWVHADEPLDRFPHARGEQHTAVYVEGEAGFEVEIVVETRPTTDAAVRLDR